jgi:hypothetical protein
MVSVLIVMRIQWTALLIASALILRWSAKLVTIALVMEVADDQA